MKNTFIFNSVFMLLAELVCNIHALKAQPFTEIANHGLPAVMQGVVKWADFDNDGDLDVFMTGNSNFFSPNPSAMTRIYKNVGNNQFVFATQNFVQLYASYAEVLDFNNDSKLDVIISGLLNNSEFSMLYINKGNFIFEPVNDTLPQVQLSSIAAADINNDGFTDFAITGYTEYGGSTHAGVYINDRNGGYYETNILPIQPTMLGSLAWGDYNNDQKPDLLQTGYYIDWQLPYPIVYYGAIYTNEGDTFTKLTTAPIRGLTGSTAWGDYDNDGDLDILLAGYIWTGSIMKGYLEVYKNTGYDNFEVYNVANSDIYVPRKARWGDYDNDGDLDIVAFGDSTGGTNQAYTRIYNNDNGIYSLNSTIHLSGVVGGDLNFVDYDNDRDLDIYVTGVNYYSMYSKLLRNDNDVVNIPPVAPKDPISTLSDHDIILQWNKTTDDHSNSNSLTYNIRMGSLCYSNDIVSPLSNISTGWRQVVQIGNTNLDTTWRINDLTHGWYCWSVQAVDNSFTGSPFSLLAVFAVGIPAATTSDATDIGKNQAAIHGFVNPRSEPAEVFFEYGLDPSPTIKTESLYVNGDSLLSFTEELGQLLEDTIYYYRIVAQNETDTVSGGTLSFRTLKYIGPTTQTTEASDIDIHSATLHGSVNAGTENTLAYFEFSCDSTQFTTTNSEILAGGSQKDIFCPVLQLLQDTVYYYRVVAQNDFETVLGGILNFRTKTDGVKENELAGIILFPNPATETINVLHLKQESAIAILDCLGNQVYNIIVTGNTDPEIIDIKQIPRGIYTVRFTFGRNQEIRKLVKL